MKSKKIQKDRVVLVEVGGSHEECLLTQIRALKAASKEVILVLDEQVAGRSAYLADEADDTRVVLKDMGSNRMIAYHIYRMLKVLRPEKVVFNTAQGTIVRNLAFKLRFSRIRCYGIIHTVRKFTESFTQKWISKTIRNYLFLSEDLLKKAGEQRHLRMDYFYPLDFPGMQSLETEKTIVITGGVEERRKDLIGCMSIIKQVKDDGYSFVFLGKSDPDNETVQSFKGELAKNGLTNTVTFFDDFVDHKTFDHYLGSASFILPLVHPNTPSAEQYFTNQISGATNLSYAYKVPLLLHEAYADIEEMQAASIYYSIEEFGSQFKRFVADRDGKVESMKAHEPYSAQYQQERYHNFILD